MNATTILVRRVKHGSAEWYRFQLKKKAYGLRGTPHYPGDPDGCGGHHELRMWGWCSKGVSIGTTVRPYGAGRAWWLAAVGQPATAGTGYGAQGGRAGRGQGLIPGALLVSGLWWAHPQAGRCCSCLFAVSVEEQAATRWQSTQ
jgi:hypothetical protein